MIMSTNEENQNIDCCFAAFLGPIDPVFGHRRRAADGGGGGEGGGGNSDEKQDYGRQMWGLNISRSLNMLCFHCVFLEFPE